MVQIIEMQEIAHWKVSHLEEIKGIFTVSAQACTTSTCFISWCRVMYLDVESKEYPVSYFNSCSYDNILSDIILPQPVFIV